MLYNTPRRQLNPVDFEIPDMPSARRRRDLQFSFFLSLCIDYVRGNSARSLARPEKVQPHRLIIL